MKNPAEPAPPHPRLRSIADAYGISCQMFRCAGYIAGSAAGVAGGVAGGVVLCFQSSAVPAGSMRAARAMSQFGIRNPPMLEREFIRPGMLVPWLSLIHI